MLRAKLAFGWPITLLLVGLLLVAGAALAQEYGSGPTFTIFPGNLTVPPWVNEVGPIYANSFTVSIEALDQSGISSFSYSVQELNPGCEETPSCEPDTYLVSGRLLYYTIDYTMGAGTGKTI